MADVSIAKVVVKKATENQDEWRAFSYASNGECIASTTDTYLNYADAEAAAYTMSEGAPVVREGDEDAADPTSDA